MGDVKKTIEMDEEFYWAIEKRMARMDELEREIEELREENKLVYKKGYDQANQDKKDQDARNTATLKKIWEDQDKRND